MIVVAGCRIHALSHDEHVAAAKAEQFLKAVVDRDPAAAYAMLSLEARKSVSESTFADTVQKMHADGYPPSVRATEYEPVPGEPAMQIFLEGEAAATRFYYRVPMAGTGASGYLPNGIYRGNQPYPRSPLRHALAK
jgi:hypothetical protein